MDIKEILKRKKEIAIILLVIIIMIIIAILAGGNDASIVPFKVTNIIVTSNVDAEKLDNDTSKNWNLNIYQNNDIYIEFAGVEDSEKISKKNSRIKEIYIDNFNYTDGPIIGDSISVYKMSDGENKLFEFTDMYKIDEKLNFEVVEENALTKNKQVNKKNGQVCLSIVNNNLKNIQISDDEVKFDGTLLGKAEIDPNEIVFNASFDLVIITEEKNKYVANIKLTLPCADLSDGFGLNQDIDVSNINFEYIEE